MQAEVLRAKIAALRAAHEEVAACAVDTLTRDDLIAAMDELETLDCQLPTQRHRMLAQLQTQTTPREMGAKSWRDVLMIRWRISTGEANRRLTEAALLGPRHALSGQPLAPVLPATAAAQGLGLITEEHVEEIRKGMARMAGFVDTATRDQVEVDWVRHAVGTGPKELKDEVNRRLFVMDQDGPVPDDTERARRRGITKGPQQPDGMIHATAEFTPAVWASLEALFAKFAAPGMCNPADEHPCTSGTPTQEQIDADTRSLAQRRHDALAFVCRHALDKTELGQHHGLPTSIIVRTTLQDLQSRAGIGVTGGGTLLPLADLLRLACHADTTHYLAVFDDATGSALDLFRARRTASVAQRLMLIARDGGCTKPSCTVPAYGTQVHHAARDWILGGLTNVDDNGLACGPDNRMVGPDGWTTRINDQHEVEWIPPPHLDTGQPRTNHYHQPEKLHPPPDDAWTPPTVADDQPATVPDDAPVRNDPPATDDPPATAPDDARGPDDPPATDDPATNRDNTTDESGDPDPPDDASALDDPATTDGSATNEPLPTDEPATNGDNTTHPSNDPDPPDDKAA